MTTLDIRRGDMREVLQSLPEGEFDSCVTDPPYELGFMGKAWDRSGVAFDPDTWRAVLRVLKPGGYLLAFGGTRRHHRMMCAVEDAGLEVHDTICWLYGSGYPKHRSKLKPAWEPIVVARKPGESATPLQIDACRIEVHDDAYARNASGDRGHAGTRSIADTGATDIRTGGGSASALGRWPANVIVDEEAAALIDAQSGELRSGANPTRRGSPKTRNTYGKFEGQTDCVAHRAADSGGASRFFYCAKASRAEREAGLFDFPRKAINWSSGEQSPGTFQSSGTDKTSSNPHPTVKPIALMRWLIRLVTPPGGRVVDPFCGSGSTGCAAALEYLPFVGIELDEHFTEIAKARAEYARLNRELRPNAGQ